MLSDEGGVGTTSSLSVRRARSRRGTLRDGLAASSAPFRPDEAREPFFGAAGLDFRGALAARLPAFARAVWALGRLAERARADPRVVPFRRLLADARVLPAFGLAIASVLSEP
jgi:hypothetical protein